MTQTQKKSMITAALLAVLTASAGCAAYDNDYDDYRAARYERNERYSRLDLDRDGRVEQWERNRWDRDRDGRVERWERDRRDPYYGRDNWRYDRYSDSVYRDRYDR